jgi:hypothetical protein
LATSFVKLQRRPSQKKKNNVTLAGVVKPMESLWNLEKAKKG